MRLPWSTHLREVDLIKLADSGAEEVMPKRARDHVAACARCSRRLAAHRRLAGVLDRPWDEVTVPRRAAVAVRARGGAQGVLGLALIVTVALVWRGLTAAPASAPGGSVPSPSAMGFPSGSAVASDGVPAGVARCFEGLPVQPSGATSGAGQSTHIAQPERLDSVHWSPDGKHLLLAGGGVELLDASGLTLLTIPYAEAATWIDADTYATGSNCESGSGVGSVVIHHLDGSAQDLPGTYETTEILGSGHGALALAPRALGPGGDPTASVVWADGVLSSPVAGAPLGWSPDGSRLLVTSGTSQGGAPAGAASAAHVSLLAYPSLKVATSFGDFALDPRYDPVFSPDGGEIAIACGPVNSVGECQQYVLDASTGQARLVAAQPAGLPLSWTHGNVLLAAEGYGHSGPLQEWDGSSKKALTAFPAGSWGVASQSGYVALETSPMGDGGTTRILDARGASVKDLPGAIGVYWSPSGAQVLLRVDTQQDLLLVSLG